MTKHDRSSLRVLGSVGEPINPRAWQWLFEVVGERRCPVIDTWWQTEVRFVEVSPLGSLLVTCCLSLVALSVRPLLAHVHLRVALTAAVTTFIQ